MNFQSCIKIPIAKQCMSPERTPSNGLAKESPNGTYSELVTIANEVFGQGNWSHSVTSQTVDFIEYVMGKYQVGCAAFVRVQLTDGTFHEEFGYSNSEGSAKGSAIYSARVSSITHALKKALTCFGGIVEERIGKIVIKKNRHKVQNADTSTPTDNQDVDKSVAQVTPSKTSRKRSKSPTELSDTPVINGEAVEDTEPAKKKESLESKPITSDKSKALIETPSVIQPTRNTAATPSTSDEKTRSFDGVQTSRPVTKPMTEEELRLERKRKQKEKQEAFQRLMREKELKNNDKPRPRY